MRAKDKALKAEMFSLAFGCQSLRGEITCRMLRRSARELPFIRQLSNLKQSFRSSSSRRAFEKLIFISRKPRSF